MQREKITRFHTGAPHTCTCEQMPLRTSSQAGPAAAQNTGGGGGGVSALSLTGSLDTRSPQVPGGSLLSPFLGQLLLILQPWTLDHLPCQVCHEMIRQKRNHPPVVSETLKETSIIIFRRFGRKFLFTCLLNSRGQVKQPDRLQRWRKTGGKLFSPVAGVRTEQESSAGPLARGPEMRQVTPLLQPSTSSSVKQSDLE